MYAPPDAAVDAPNALSSRRLSRTNNVRVRSDDDSDAILYDGHASPLSDADACPPADTYGDEQEDWRRLRSDTAHFFGRYGAGIAHFAQGTFFAVILMRDRASLNKVFLLWLLALTVLNFLSAFNHERSRRPYKKMRKYTHMANFVLSAARTFVLCFDRTRSHALMPWLLLFDAHVLNHAGVLSTAQQSKITILSGLWGHLYLVALGRSHSFLSDSTTCSFIWCFAIVAVMLLLLMSLTWRGLFQLGEIEERCIVSHVVLCSIGAAAVVLFAAAVPNPDANKGSLALALEELTPSVLPRLFAFSSLFFWLVSLVVWCFVLRGRHVLTGDPRFRQPATLFEVREMNLLEESPLRPVDANTAAARRLSADANAGAPIGIENRGAADGRRTSTSSSTVSSGPTEVNHLDYAPVPGVPKLRTSANRTTE